MAVLFPFLLWGILWVYHLSSIGTVPAGLMYDEAYNALDAMKIGREGNWPLFLPENYGREPLFAYMMSASLRLFGPSVWAVRFPAALCWGLVLPSLFWLIWELFGTGAPKGEIFPAWKRIWLAAGTLMVTSPWFGITAHFAIRHILFLLLEILFFASLWRAWNRNAPAWGAAAGLFGGLAFYSYLPNRLFPLILIPMLAVGWFCRRPALHERRRTLLLTVVVAAVVMAPLLIYFAGHPSDFLQRSSQVAIVGGQGQASSAGGTMPALLENTRRIAGMFFLHGDTNPRANLPGRPVFTWWILPLAIGSIIYSVVKRGWRIFFLWLWLAVMLLPSALSDFAPHFQRSVGALPPLMILMGVGMDGIAALGKRLHRRHLFGAVALALVLVEAGQGLVAFREWTTRPDLFDAFEEGLTTIGRYMSEQPDSQILYLSPRTSMHPTFRFFREISQNSPPMPRSFDGRTVLVLSPEQDARYVIISREDFRFELMMPWIWPARQPGQVEEFLDRAGNVYARVFEAPAGLPVRSPLWASQASWDDHIRLIGADPVQCCTYRPGEILYLELWWTTDGAPPQQRWTVFAHLLDNSGKVVAGDDSEPGDGSYPTTSWHAGEIIITESQLPIPEGIAAGTYSLEIGWYDWQSGRRLSLCDGTDALNLGEIRIGGAEDEAE